MGFIRKPARPLKNGRDWQQELTARVSGKSRQQEPNGHATRVVKQKPKAKMLCRCCSGFDVFLGFLTRQLKTGLKSASEDLCIHN
jgi:hypothetical protein